LAALAVITQGLVARWLQPRVRTVIASVDEPSHDLEVLAGLLRVLERERFTSPHLEALRQSLGAGERASREIARLSQLVAVLASRRNIIFAFTAALMLWATQWAFAIEAWRARAGTHVTHWLDVIGEFEALLALGGFAAEHPAYVYPEIVDGAPVFTATALAHPALGPAAVANTIDLRRDGLRLLVVSGSNMSGKSTWLRTIGASLVLAGMGAPVRASTCRVSPMAIGAAIRVQDSLTDGRSRFFAEITRLKQVVDLTRASNGDVLFLLDEILSGTNSHDRRIGADALLRGLVAAGAVGLVTTHDLALADIVGPLAGQADNAHFEDRFADGTLSFDYTLKPGLVRTSNALALMRSIGLDV
jgi:DNA mismatch repair ATPase MutS